MMNKKMMLLFLGSATLGCAASTNASPNDCAKMTTLRLTVDEYRLSLNNKKPICVAVPGTFKIVIRQPANSTVTIGAGDVTVTAKASTGLTINGSNTAPVNKVTVTVDGDADIDDEFGFWINVNGVGKLDPKVRVVGSSTMLNLKSQEFYDTLDTLNLTLEDANKLKPPPQPAASE
jgi:hypothetical protein